MRSRDKTRRGGKGCTAVPKHGLACLRPWVAPPVHTKGRPEEGRNMSPGPACMIEVRVSAEVGDLGGSCGVWSWKWHQLNGSGDTAVGISGEMMWHLCAEVLSFGAEAGYRGQI